jgi:TonB-dependent SusC/RagA subfamily outer membrane receptor
LIFVSEYCYKRRKRTNNNYRWVCWRIRFVKSNDIETITVLKDAQAAIYGTIGANGVILITTKTGKKNSKPRIRIHIQVFRKQQVAWLVDATDMHYSMKVMQTEVIQFLSLM